MTFDKVLKGLNGKVPSNVDAVNMTQNPKFTLKLVRKAQTTHREPRPPATLEQIKWQGDQPVVE
jgi:hypothetical protein